MSSHCHRRVSLLFFAICLFVLSDVQAGEERPSEGEAGPIVNIPKIARVPSIDGVISEGEWSHAAEISGFMGANGFWGGRLTPQESRIYVAHDGKRFYLAVFCELPEGVKPSMNYRKRNEPVYLDNYQVELWLTPPVEGELVTYQMIGNAYGAIYDNRQRPQLGVSEVSWDGGWEFKNTYQTGKYWSAELAIDFADLSDKPVTPEQLWRGLVAVAWPQRSWPYTFGFYKAVDTHARFRFADDGDCVQIKSLQSLLKNRLAPELRLVNGSENDQTFTVRIQAGDVLEEAKVKVPANGAAPFTVDRELPPFPAGVRSLKTSIRVADEAGRELIQGDWFYAADLVPPAREARVEEKQVFDIRVQFAPLSLGVSAWADLLDYPKRDQVRSVAFAIHPAAGGNAVAATNVSKFAYDSAETLLWLPKDLPFGEYTTRIGFLDADGKPLDKREQTFVYEDLKKKFIWLGNDLGKQIRVEPPFEPVSVEGSVLRVWGRSLEMAPGGFPAQITSQGRELLARPITLIAEMDGRKETARPTGAFRILSSTPEAVTFSGGYDLAGLAISLSGRLEFDGMLTYELEAVPKDGADGANVRRLYLSMPVREDRALYYYSTGGGWNPAYGLTSDVKSGRVWESTVHGDFVPYVGLTDDDVALQWFGDQDHGWVLGKDAPCAEIIRDAETVEVQINLVRREGPVPAFHAEFGFIASPVRPVLPHWRNTVLDGSPMAGSRVNFFYGPGHGGTPIDLHDTARLAKALGIDTSGKNPDEVLRDRAPSDYRKVPKEQILEAIEPAKRSSLDRIWNKSTEDPLQTIPCYFYNAKMYFEGNRSEAFRTFFPGEWQLDPPSGWFHLTTTESYNDFFAFHLDLWFKHWIVPGLYFDEVYLAPDFNVFNGNGRVMSDGSIRPSFPLAQQRRYLQRMRQLYFDNKRTPFIWVHTTDYMAPQAISSAEIAMFGENASPTPTRDIIDTINPLLFRSIGRAQKFGFVPVWMTMSGRGGSPWSKAGRQTLGWCWMHDVVPEVHPTMRGRNLVALRAKWGIDQDGVSFLPYWKQPAAIHTSDPKFLASAWIRPGGRVLVAVMNLHKDGPEDVEISIDPEALGISGPFTVKDLESGPYARQLNAAMSEIDTVIATSGQRNPREVAELAKPWADLVERAPDDWDKLEVLSRSKNFKVTVPHRDFRLLMIEPSND